MKEIAIVSRILLGAVFIFSGFVKGIDPLGSTYKFIDYFTAFDMMWMHEYAFVLAILQNAAEFVIGVALMLGLRMKVTAWLTAIFMVFFTRLTYVLARTNPVTDCGCFGDALILTNWETFYKNLILMAPTLIVFIYRKKYLSPFSSAGDWFLVILLTIGMIKISLHCYDHLPWVDFRPYRIGADIPQGMIIPDDAPVDEYHSTVFYEKDGVVKEFELSEAPFDDPEWEWKDTKTVLLKEGYKPPIHDFSITTSNGNDITDEVLSDKGYTFLLVAHDLSKSDSVGLEKASQIYNFCKKHGYKFYCLTSSLMSDVEELKSEHKLNYEFCNTDDITLKTIIRANPGLVLLQNGTVIGKWHHNDIPEATSLKPNLLSLMLENQANSNTTKLIYCLVLAFLLFAFAVYHWKIRE